MILKTAVILDMLLEPGRLFYLDCMIGSLSLNIKLHGMYVIRIE